VAALCLQRRGTIAASRQASMDEATCRARAARNELHWVLDMVFDEDRSRIRDRNAATNLALLRKLSLTLLKREQSRGVG
jgi:predicted transposase YbfD/YdcC